MGEEIGALGGFRSPLHSHAEEGGTDLHSVLDPRSPPPRQNAWNDPPYSAPDIHTYSSKKDGTPSIPSISAHQNSNMQFAGSHRSRPKRRHSDNRKSKNEGQAWSRDPKASSDSYNGSKARSRSHSVGHSGSYNSISEGATQRPHKRSINISSGSRDDLSLVSISGDLRSNGSREIVARDLVTTPPHGAGMYPPRNRYNIRLPPLNKKPFL